ncbi:MAG: energy-coupling factor ABC transporter permease [Neisseria sp.]|nr:energy-coupling factor ABC transporter permease [Neisseria sp.]
MNLWAHHFPLPALIGAWLLLAILLTVAAYLLPRQNIPPRSWLLAGVLVALLWSIHAQMHGGEQAGMSYHLLGATLVTLVLGLPAALWLMTVMAVIYAVVFQGFANVSAVGLNMMCIVLPTLLLTDILLYLARRTLPHHLFVFIFVNGFFAAALGMMFGGALCLFLLDLAAAYPSEILWRRAFPVFFLLSWGEAFFTGLITAVLVAFAPQLVVQYSDEMYLPQEKSLFDE